MISPTYLEALRAICQPIRASEYPRSLQPMRQLLHALGDPQRRFPSVIVAGSIGKGTTSHHIARLLRGAGLRVGLFTSPHLHSFCERFVIDETRISHPEFVEAMRVISNITGVGKGLRPSPTENSVYSTFEQATALAAWWFAQRKVDIAVLEVGLGGRWDAVNAIPNVLAVLTTIEEEHLAMLGGSLRSIAWHKAGIIRERGYAITGRQHTEVAAILQHEADNRGAKLQEVTIPTDATPDEAAAYLALAAYRSLTDRKIITRKAFHLQPNFPRLPGRREELTVRGRRVLIDGGHTPMAALYLREAISDLVRLSQRVRMVVGMLQDKAVHEYLSAFDDEAFHIVFTQAPGHRGLTPYSLQASFVPHYATTEIVPDLNDALAQVESAPEALFVVAGSLRMAAAAREAYGLLSPEEMDEARHTRAIFEGEDYLAKLRVRPSSAGKKRGN
jgi:dihydrofolate synthase/folylpolyglutamate synthase